MSIAQMWWRLDPDELTNLIEHPDRVEDACVDIDRASRELTDWPVPDPGVVPLATGSTVFWDVHRFVLSHAGGPVAILDGGRFFLGREFDEWFPRYLPAEEVAEAAGWLTEISFDELIASIDPDDPEWEDLYKFGGRKDMRESGLALLRQEYEEDLVPFFAAAAHAGQAVLLQRC